MTPQRGPHYAKNCPFHIKPNQPLSAAESVVRCVECVARGCDPLKRSKPDLHQLAYLTILENSPKYDPKHKSGASLGTFIRARVCAKLWNERDKALKAIPYSVLEGDKGTQHQKVNRLMDGLVAEALLHDGVEDTVAWEVDVENFKIALPQLLGCLSENERTVVEMKFYEGVRAVEIAGRLGLSEGRISQLSRTALAKLSKAYLFGISQS
jgi:RNA polymerase sigma factor (sigma-70 family)